MEELFLKITGVISWAVLGLFFVPLIFIGIIQFLSVCFAIIFNFVMCIVNPKYFIDFYTSIENNDYE